MTEKGISSPEDFFATARASASCKAETGDGGTKYEIPPRVSVLPVDWIDACAADSEAKNAKTASSFIACVLRVLVEEEWPQEPELQGSSNSALLYGLVIAFRPPDYMNVIVRRHRQHRQ